MKESQVLTSVKVNEAIWDEFRISCVKYKFSFQKLSDRAMHLYVTDPEFRKQIHNHTNIEIKQEEK
jgi:hypothetical protein